MTPVKEAVRELWHALRMGSMPKRQRVASRIHILKDEQDIAREERECVRKRRCITAMTVEKIKASPLSARELARQLGIGRTTVMRIRAGGVK